MCLESEALRAVVGRIGRELLDGGEGILTLLAGLNVLVHLAEAFALQATLKIGDDLLFAEMGHAGPLKFLEWNPGAGLNRCFRELPPDTHKGLGILPELVGKEDFKPQILTAPAFEFQGQLIPFVQVETGRKP